MLVESFGPGALERARPGRCGSPVMPRLKQSFERAAGAVGKLDAIDTDHLLLGVTEVHVALDVKLLERLGISPDSVPATIEAQRRRASKTCPPPCQRSDDLDRSDKAAYGLPAKAVSPGIVLGLRFPRRRTPADRAR
jgi:Clp amino terminal domain, pathogenicity island component